MSSIDDGEVYLEIQGAERDELEDGLVAVRRVFARRNVCAADAIEAGISVNDFGRMTLPTDDELKLAAIAMEALEAAELAACEERAFEPEWLDLSLMESSEVMARPGQEPHYKMRERQALPELPLGLPPLDPRLVMYR